MTKYPIYLILLFVLLPSLLSAQPDLVSTHYYSPKDVPPGEHALDVTKLIVDVKFKPAEGIVYGTTTQSFKVLRQTLDSVYLDGEEIEIKSVSMNGKQLKYTRDKKGVMINFPKTMIVGDVGVYTIEFSSKPRWGVFFTGWESNDVRKHKQIWTQGGHKQWLPAYHGANDKMITETIITFDGSYQVLSNGRKVDELDNGDGTHTWHYSMTKPHALYLLMFAIGKYKYKSFSTKNGTPLQLWYYPEHEDRFWNIYKWSAEAVEFVEQHTGVAYPWESYAQVPVQDYMFGAMENTTSTIFGDKYCGDDRDILDKSYWQVNVHELTHQWFGNLITARGSRGTWLQESFATFYPKLFIRKYLGEDYYQWERRKEHTRALSAAENDNNPISSSTGGVNRWYPKGSAVLDMMMYTFGEEAYQRVIKHYLEKYAYQNVETNDLYQSFQDVLGLSPEWFFNQWVYDGGEPHYEINYEDKHKNRKWYTSINVRQIQPRDNVVGLFKMPVNVEVYYTNGKTAKASQWVAKEYEEILIENPDGYVIDFVLFDPGSRILKKVTFKRKLVELESQALKAPLMIDRLDAVKAMADFDIKETRLTLMNVFRRERFFAIRAEVVRQLTGDYHLASKALLRSALKDKDHRVRLSAINSVESIPEDMRVDYERLLRDSSYLVVSSALDKLSGNFPTRVPVYLQRTKGVYGRGNRINVKWHEIAADYLKDRNSIRALTTYASYKYEYKTRVFAIQSLQRLGYMDAPHLDNLFNALFAQNFKTVNAAKAALHYYYQVTDYKNMIDLKYKSGEWEQWQKNLIHEINKKG